MPKPISAFFEELGYPLRNARTSWGAERNGVVVLSTWADETTESPPAVKVLRPLATYAPGKRVGLRERREQLSHLWSGARAGYVVTARAKDPAGSRSIASYDDTSVRAIESLFERDGDIWARLGDTVSVASFPAHHLRFRTSRAAGVFPPDEPQSLDVGNKHSFEQRLRRFTTVEVRPQQRAFREAVFRNFGGECAVSGCTVPEALEAAHLRGREWKQGHNTAQDGVLLRRDLHALYDCELLHFSNEGIVALEPRVSGEYKEFIDVQARRKGTAWTTR